MRMLGGVMSAVTGSIWVERLALLALCSAYLQGGIYKLLDFPGAVTEQARLELRPPVLFALAAVITELAGSALVLSGYWRWVGALWLGGFTLVASLIADRFWRSSGAQRLIGMDTFFEHAGLAGAFLLVAVIDLRGAW
jgi:uncharacterized membrane protein YphA (DoxX/SURF4 family)